MSVDRQVFSVADERGVVREYTRFFVFHIRDRAYGAFYLESPDAEKKDGNEVFLFLWDEEALVYVFPPDNEETSLAEGVFAQEYVPSYEAQGLANVQNPSSDEARALADRWMYLLSSGGSRED